MHSRSSRAEATQVLNSLRRIVQGLRATAHAVEHRLGISGAQLFVLRELAREPGLSIRGLSERTFTDPSSVSVVVARLAARKLVRRQRDAGDARRSVLSLSPRGARLLGRAREPFHSRLVRAVAALPPERLRRLNRDLRGIVEAVGVGGRATPMFFDEAPKGRVRGGP